MSDNTPDPDTLDEATIVAWTRSWVEHAVIGLNLCPFANSVFRNQQIAYRVSHAREPESLLQDLTQAMHSLLSTPAATMDTLLLIHPWALTDFLDFNDFLGIAEALLEDSGLSGVLQLASFHPQYQFAGVAADDVTNGTNRSPFPVLHLLREDSLDSAIASVPDTDTIIERNLATLRRLGKTGLLELQERIAQSVRTGQR